MFSCDRYAHGYAAVAGCALTMWRQRISALLGGLIFGAGLVVSGMTDPQKVLAFLTLNAHWDPALIFVMGSAVLVATAGFALTRRRVKPLFDEIFRTPVNTVIDKRLISGAAVFGVGWGVAGFCPGPALVGVMNGDLRAGVFVLAFVVGMMLFEQWSSRRSVNVSGTADG